jgi:hypothetical protein
VTVKTMLDIKTQPKCFHFFTALLTTHFVTVNRNIWYDCDESASQIQTDGQLGLSENLLSVYRHSARLF